MNKEKKLVKRIINGEQSAFAELVKDYERLVAHIVYTTIGHPAEHDDLCQDIFIKVYTNLSGFQFRSKLSTWIGRIAYHTCINHLAEKKQVFEDIDDMLTRDNLSSRLINITPDEFNADYPFQKHELRRIIEQKIRELPEKYQTVFILYHLDEMSYKEIADILDVTLENTKVMLFRARNMLRSKILLDYKKEDIWN